MNILDRIRQPINTIFLVQVLLTFFVIFSAAPRELAFGIAAIYVGFVFVRSLQESVQLFIRSIPIFIAMPFPGGLDNLNMWRFFVLALFIKWVVSHDVIRIFFHHGNKSLTEIIQVGIRKYRFELFASAFLIISIFSMTQAVDGIAAIKRLIYFGSMGALFVVVRSIFRSGEKLTPYLWQFVIGLIVPVIIALIQLWSSYAYDLATFMYTWAAEIQLAQYGTQWSEIVRGLNTWFTDTISTAPRLRFFATFPDSHTFPLYIVLSLPAMLFLIFKNSASKIVVFDSLRASIRKKFEIGKTEIILSGFTGLLLAMAVLSGTRGIWAAAIVPMISLGILKLFKAVSWGKIMVWSSVFAMFVVSFVITFMVYLTPQFLLESQVQDQAFVSRILSIISTSETSNAGRIYIWQKSLDSFIDKPWLGVGIGNFPAVLGEPVILAKAGSSAHNLYFNFITEVGAVGAVFVGLALLELLVIAWYMNRSRNSHHALFGFVVGMSLIWVYAYGMTDAALVDERTLLLFMALAGLLVGLQKQLRLGK